MILALNSSVKIKYLQDPDVLSWVLCDCKEEMPTIEYKARSHQSNWSLRWYPLKYSLVLVWSLKSSKDIRHDVYNRLRIVNTGKTFQKKFQDSNRIHLVWRGNHVKFTDNVSIHTLEHTCIIIYLISCSIREGKSHWLNRAEYLKFQCNTFITKSDGITGLHGDKQKPERVPFSRTSYQLGLSPG